MKTINSILLAPAFIAVVIIFLIFISGAITLKLMNNNKNESEAMNQSSRMWIPTFVCFFLSALLSWVIFS